MKSMKFKYPGDPVSECTQMNLKEFLERFPREPIRIYAGDKLVNEIPMEVDEIICDFCSACPEDTVYLIYGNKAICPSCFQSMILPHVIK